MDSFGSEAAPHRILVVDDNVGTADILAQLLRLLGPHEVVIAHDGPAALETAARFRPDIILLDIGLPGMSGLEVARTLRENGGFHETLLVAVTAYADEQDREQALQAGFDDHMPKPMDIVRLSELLQRPPAPSRVA